MSKSKTRQAWNKDLGQYLITSARLFIAGKNLCEKRVVQSFTAFRIMWPWAHLHRWRWDYYIILFFWVSFILFFSKYSVWGRGREKKKIYVLFIFLLSVRYDDKMGVFFKKKRKKEGYLGTKQKKNGMFECVLGRRKIPSSYLQLPFQPSWLLLQLP